MKFQSKDETSSKDDLASLLQDCRLLRKDDLQVNRIYKYCSIWARNVKISHVSLNTRNI